MSHYEKILCPVDLSANSLAAVELATTIAKQHNAKLIFAYVCSEWLPDDSLLGSEFLETVITEDRETLSQIKPSDDTVAYEHLFLQGNPGPEIVQAAKSCDLVVLSTHGDSAIVRLLVGSVAHYVMRHASCPVVTFRQPKNSETKPEEPKTEKQKTPRKTKKTPFVTKFMHPASPVHDFDSLEQVVSELQNAGDTAAPVVDEFGVCIGILTKTDIEKYHELKQRFENHDETVLDEMFEIDEFGQRRPTNYDFDQVKRHMTSPVITICSNETCQTANELFLGNPSIHHLVVVDESDRAVGIVEPKDLAKCEGLTAST